MEVATLQLTTKYACFAKYFFETRFDFEENNASGLIDGLVVLFFFFVL